MIAISEPVSTIRCSSDSMTTWVRCESRVPIIGSASTPSHSFTTGVDSSSISSCWRAITSSRFFWNTLTVYRPSWSSSAETPRSCAAIRRGASALACSTASNSGCLSEKMKVAVSAALKPLSTRSRDSSSRKWRTSAQGSPCRPSASPAAAAAAGSRRQNSRARASSSRGEARPSWPVCSRLARQAGPPGLDDRVLAGLEGGERRRVESGHADSLLAQPDDPGASGSPDRLDGSGHRRHAAPGPPIRPGHPVKKA